MSPSEPEVLQSPAEVDGAGLLAMSVWSEGRNFKKGYIAENIFCLSISARFAINLWQVVKLALPARNLRASSNINRICRTIEINCVLPSLRIQQHLTGAKWHCLYLVRCLMAKWKEQINRMYQIILLWRVTVTHRLVVF